MGGWKLESFKMGIYMLFPVGVFWWFNQPAFFEDWMKEKRRQLYPPEDPKARATILETIEMMEQKRQAQLDASFQELKSER